MSRPERYFKILTCWINLTKEKLEYLLHQPQRPPFPVSPIPKRRWIHKNWDPTPKLIFGGSMRVQNNNKSAPLWQNQKCTLTEKIFRQINHLLNNFFSRTVTFTKFLPKSVRANFSHINLTIFFSF